MNGYLSHSQEFASSFFLQGEEPVCVAVGELHSPKAPSDLVKLINQMELPLPVRSMKFTNKWEINKQSFFPCQIWRFLEYLFIDAYYTLFSFFVGLKVAV